MQKRSNALFGGRIPRFLQALLILPLLLAFFGMSTASAQAAQTWMPNYDSGTSVYLSPGLANHPQWPVSLNGLSGRLSDANKVHGLKFIYIMTEQGTETNPTSAKFAVWKLDDYVARIQNKLPADDYVIVLVVRSAADPNKFSIAAQGGNRLQQYRLNASWFSSAGGPLDGPRSTYLPNDPVGYGAAVAQNVNQGVTSYLAEQKRIEDDRRAAEEAERQRQIQAEKDRIAREAFMKALPGNIAFYGIPSLVLIALLVLLVLYRSTQGKLQGAVGEWQTKFDNANTNYLSLKDAYFGFLQSQGTDWSKRFKNTTLKTYTAAVSQFGDLSARIKVAMDLLTEARKAADTTLVKRALFLAGGAVVALIVGWLVLPLVLAVYGFLALAAIWLIHTSRRSALRGLAQLQTNSVTITGNQLPQEMVSFFGSAVEEKTYANPPAMLQDMEALYNATNTALASIVKSFDGARQNRKDIEGLTAAIEEAKTALETAQLNFDPYDGRFQAIKRDTGAFLEILDSDPMSAFQSSEEVEQAAEALKGHIAKAIELKGELAKTLATINGAAQKVTTQRATAVPYKYALGDGETQSLTAGANFILNEEGGNPDTLLATAREHYTAAGAAVLAGDLTKTQTEKAAAEKAAGDSNALVDDILAAKSYVEKNVTPVRSSLTKLTADIEPADVALTELRAEFLETNFAGEPGKIDTAKKERDGTAGELAKVKKAYDEQRYLAARKILSKQGTDLSNSINALVEVHSRLAELRRLKAHAKKTVAAAAEKVRALVTKLETNKFTTSAETDRSFSSLAPSLTAQKADVAKEITDWPAAAAAADKLLASYNAVDSKIDDERKAYELAVQRVGELRSTVSDASSAVSHNDTRQPARDKLGEAQRALSASEGELKVAKSDWNAIGRRAENNKGLAGEAKRLALADQRLAQEARSAIDQAEREVDRVAVRTFVQTASWGGYSQVITWAGVLDLSNARGYLREANSDLRNRDYEGAKTSAANAERAAEAAEDKANAALALEVTRQINEWKEIERRKEEERLERERKEREEREERERKEREEREERDRQNRNNDNDWGGGGRSGGTSHSGGRSGGVGDF